MRIFKACAPIYHYTLALIGDLYYRFPSRHIHIVAVTGTKGKTSVVEFINAILEADGQKTALASTLRFKIGNESERNLHKMTTPGRFFLQHFLARAHKAECTWAIIEVTSEAAKQYRHRFLHLDAVVVTHISPEHIESHGSFEKYVQAKYSIAKALEKSIKKETMLILNDDDPHQASFKDISARELYTYKLEDAKPYTTEEDKTTLTFQDTYITSPLPGLVTVYNILAALTFAHAIHIPLATAQKGIESLAEIRGRFERVDAGQNFTVLIDYAHTADSLEKAYSAFKDKRKICVLGATGGGRDKWKRKDIGRIADNNCAEVIITNEDPYDEDPDQIIMDVASGVTGKEPRIIRDRRTAIRAGLEHANNNDVVFITGKGTDPYIMGPNGSKEEWSDRDVAEEELKKLLTKRHS